MSLLDDEILENTSTNSIIESKFPKFEEVSSEAIWFWGIESYDYTWDDKIGLSLLNRFEGLNIPNKSSINKNKYSIYNISAMYYPIRKIIVTYSYTYPKWCSPDNIDTKKKHWVVTLHIWLADLDFPIPDTSWKYKINILEFSYTKKADAQSFAYQLLTYLKDNPTIITKLAVIDSKICNDMDDNFIIPLFTEFKDLKNNKIDKYWKQYAIFD